ncbi:uncharacterized protein B0P05DRAFT_192415 [Gilbertella persicaria]|uniref:uncharacterized protein n=1 Tax=Gilbertella persicaria TaxID=101096 RepID=UPI00221E8D43|nr:uncharacterized protein B0P05DRAFT_192415 [Gilbertella persicaria]KAI8069858.1 hypothetical protein B0P05DRAFT_192415 [Gilbertella persicaria]
MTKDSPIGNNAWKFVEPGSDTFTKLCSTIGAHGIQVEQIPLLDKENIRHLRPILGFFILLQQQPIPEQDTLPSTKQPIYFSQQTTHDAYAMHALLHIVMNMSSKINISDNLDNFRHCTQYLSSKSTSVAIYNNQLLIQAYNRLSRHSTEQGNTIYRPISYIRRDGYLWELDGLKKYPLRLRACHENNWLEIAQEEMTRKIQAHTTVPASIWAVIEDRKLVYQRRLIGLSYVKHKIEAILDLQEPSWRKKMNIQQWEEEYRFTMHHNKRIQQGLIVSNELYNNYCRSFTQLPPEEQDVFSHTFYEYMKREDKMDVWLKIQDDLLRLYERLGIEFEKDMMFEVRRQFDYMPFIRSFIQGLYQEGHLHSIVNN